MSILNGILGGVLGAAATNLVKSYVEKSGGVQGIVSKFEQGGLGDVAKSWVSTGKNLPVNSEQIQKALGNDQISQIAGSLGIPSDKLTAQLSKHLPGFIDKLTPNGKIENKAA